MAAPHLSRRYRLWCWAGPAVAVAVTAACLLTAVAAAGPAALRPRSSDGLQDDGGESPQVVSLAARVPLSPDGSPPPQDDFVALLECRVGSASPPSVADDTTVSAPYLCYVGVTVTADADGRCGVVVMEDWTWPYTTGRDARRVVPAATAAAGFTGLTVAQGMPTRNGTGAAAVTVGPPLTMRATSTSCVDGDTINWPTARLPLTPSTYRVAYRLGAGQSAADGIGGAPPAPANGTSVGNGTVVPVARRSLTWSPGSDWLKTLYNVRVRFVLPPGSTTVTATGPGANRAELSGGGGSGAPTAPPVVTFPFRTVGVGAEAEWITVTYTPGSAGGGGVAPLACAAPVAPDVCIGQYGDGADWSVDVDWGTALGVAGGLVFIATCFTILCKYSNPLAAEGGGHARRGATGGAFVGSFGYGGGGGFAGGGGGGCAGGGGGGGGGGCGGGGGGGGGG